jgi:hypothetical protein
VIDLKFDPLTPTKASGSSLKVDDGKDSDNTNYSLVEEQGSHASNDSSESKSDSNAEHKTPFTKSILKQRKSVTFDLQRNTIQFIEMCGF